MDSNQPMTELVHKYPRFFVGRHVAGMMLSVSNPGLEKLHEFRKQLEAGRFKPAPGGAP